jgi:uncharacterized membrane protein YeaQ/YmgE (transglycosylase-associated protein family)
MEVTMTELAVWIVVGALAGSLAGMVVMRRKEGFGRWVNLGVGLAGALIGGFLFDILNIDLGLADISISLGDVVAAFVGALIFWVAVWAVLRARQKKMMKKV